MENTSEERDELISKACEIFPEYSDKILGRATTCALDVSSEGSNEPVVDLSREASDSETMTYVEYSDGTVLLSYFDFGKKITYVDQTTSSIVTNYTVNITATCVGRDAASGYSEYFKISNAKYAIVSGQYDSITSAGTTSSSSNCSIEAAVNYVANETASTAAKLQYNLNWFVRSGGDVLGSKLTLTVRNNVATVTHVQT